MLFSAISTRWRPRGIQIAVLVSLLFHAIVLFVPRHAPPGAGGMRRFDATLRADASARPDKPAEPAPPEPPEKKRRRAPAPTAREHTAVIATPLPQFMRQPTPQWTTKQKDEMSAFLDELAAESRARPTLAQRATAQAQAIGREGPPPATDDVLLDRIPGSPAVDPFSLDMYLNGLVSKLNRSADFVRNDPRTQGVRTAVVHIQLAPDGTLRKFEVVDAADQSDEIAYLRKVIERAVPFPAFPPDIVRSANGLNMLFCIRPPSLTDGAVGFSRIPAGGRCR